MQPNLQLSFLDIINICDNTRVRQVSPLPSPFDSELLTPLYLSESPDSPVIGLLRPIIIQQLKLENSRSSKLGQQEVWVFEESGNGSSSGRACFQNWLDTPAKRTEALKEVCERWRDTRLFDDVCGPAKWRDELYPVYGDPFGPHDHPANSVPGQKLNFAFEMERSACALFGVVTYGVHMSIYEELEPEGQRRMQVWVPTRSRTKQTWPGFLDNTVAGGIPSGMSIFESLVKESMEEASIPAEITRKHVRTVGAISYFLRTSKGWLQPEVEYVYDLRIPSDVDPTPFTPKPHDNEVEIFELLSHDAVIERMQRGLFKPNCALVLIDLFIRLGYITPDNEPDYMKIITRLHGQFDFERW